MDQNDADERQRHVSQPGAVGQGMGNEANSGAANSGARDQGDGEGDATMAAGGGLAAGNDARDPARDQDLSGAASAAESAGDTGEVGRVGRSERQGQGGYGNDTGFVGGTRAAQDDQAQGGGAR